VTLIITALADDSVVQVSDRRLTWPDGSLYSENATKAICIACSDARLSLAYTGLARIGTTSTDRWLVDTLIESGAALKTFPELVESLATIATMRFRRLTELGDRRGLTLILSGFGPPGPMMALVSNFEDSTGRRLSNVSENFVTGYWLRNHQPMRKLDLDVSGAEAALTGEILEAIERIRGRFLNRAPRDRVAVLVQVLRLAAKHPKYGRLIGQDCMGTIVMPNGEFRTTYHSCGGTAISYMPHYVSASLVAHDIWVSTDEGQRPAFAPRRR
jgi:hypothetical protein